MPLSVPKKCHEVIKLLLPYWHKVPDFGHQMMSQFLDDIGGYVEEYEKHGSLRNCLSKACSVLELLVVLIEIYVQDRNSVQQFYWDVLQQSLNSCTSSMTQLGSEPSFRVGVFLSEYCGIFSTAVPLVDSQNIHIVSKCTTTAVEIMHKFCANETAVVNCIKYFTTIFTVASLPAEFTVPLTEKLGILGEPSVFQLSVFGRPKLASALLSLLTSMMCPSVLPLLLASYTTVREKLLAEVASLRDENADALTDMRETEARLLILIGAFAALASLKSSLIVMMGLRPSLFHLLLNEMPLTEQWFITKYPAVHYCLLNVMHTHVASHDYFLSNSEWLVQSNSPSCMYAKEQLLAIDRLLSSHIQWEHTKALCVKWLHGLLSGIDDSAMTTLAYRPEFVRIRGAVLNALISEKPSEKLTAVALRLNAHCATDNQNAVAITKSVISKV
ncbi:hypothetical protein COOONC_04276, partial [Cooperia oncophora]